MPTICVSIEGNIGSGKSTLLNQLKKERPDWVFVDEPVAQWLSMKNEKGESLLELFYNDKRRWSYTFQNCAIFNRFMALKSAIEKLDPSKNNILVMERSIYTDKFVFAKMLYEAGEMDSLEWKIYNDWFGHAQSLTPTLNGIIYVTVDSEKCVERIGLRHREGESAIPLDYLESLSKYHDKWLVGSKNVFIFENKDTGGAALNTEAVQAFVESLV